MNKTKLTLTALSVVLIAEIAAVLRITDHGVQAYVPLAILLAGNVAGRLASIFRGNFHFSLSSWLGRSLLAWALLCLLVAVFVAGTFLVARPIPRVVFCNTNDNGRTICADLRGRSAEFYQSDDGAMVSYHATWVKRADFVAWLGCYEKPGCVYQPTMQEWGVHVGEWIVDGNTHYFKIGGSRNVELDRQFAENRRVSQSLPPLPPGGNH